MAQPTFHLLCGRIGSGKTTFAKKLARDIGAVRLAHDEWMARIYGSRPPETEYRANFSRVEELIWKRAEAIVRDGGDVIIDFGFWTRESRDVARDRIAAAGGVARFYDIACSRELALERTMRRSENPPPDSLWIDRAAFDKFDALYEPMQADEEFVTIDTNV